jgi:hypothetical protein
MIRSITGTNKYLQVNDGNPGSTYVSPMVGALNVGQLRYNTSIQAMEVYDGNNWNIIHSTHASVELTSDAITVLDWAKSKMQEEAKLKELMIKHPGLKELNDKFEMLKLLCEQEEENEA